MPIDQLSITVSSHEFKAMVKFYTATLAPLGYAHVVNYEKVVAFGLGGKTDLCITAGYEDIYERDARPLIIAFATNTREQVDQCYQAAIKTGLTWDNDRSLGQMRDDGFGQMDYTASLNDPKGNLVEIVCRSVPSS